jgi:filamentous hemagglutinin
MQKALAVNPDNQLKRLGDGYHEQTLIREQITRATGQRYLDGQRSDEAQYRMLMDNGIAFARQYGLAPGVALTAEQMAQLTTSIVWLVTQTVTLPDGDHRTGAGAAGVPEGEAERGERQRHAACGQPGDI